MSKGRNRVKPRPLGYHFDQEQPYIHPENGRLSCKWCKGRVDPPKRHWCGREECVFEWMRRTSWRLTRLAVFHRDKGICAWCGLDAVAMAADYRAGYMAAIRDPIQAEADLSWSTVLRYIPDGSGWALRKWKPRDPAWCGFPERFAAANDLPASSFARNGVIWEVDHITPIWEGGDWFGMFNLQTLCSTCHRIKTQIDDGRRKGTGFPAWGCRKTEPKKRAKILHVPRLEIPPDVVRSRSGVA
jgi:5-methylcytosine-specific restriction endonuclease McrA